MNVLISVILGLLPEILFYNVMMFRLKNIKANRIKFIFVNLVYTVVLMLFTQYTVLFHVLYIAGTVLQYRLFYRKNIEIIDVFALTDILCVVMLISVVCYPIGRINNASSYYIAFVLHRVLLVISYFALKNIGKHAYILYKQNWNRHDGAKIKSITVRNISLCACNAFIFFAFIILQQWLSIK